MVSAALLSVAMQLLTKSILSVKTKPPAVAGFDDPSRTGRREMGRHDQCRGAGMLFQKFPPGGGGLRGGHAETAVQVRFGTLQRMMHQVATHHRIG